MSIQDCDVFQLPNSTCDENDLVISEHVSLCDKNWFATGGPARFFCEPIDDRQFEQALFWAKDKNVPVFVLGLGANILISDDGFLGLVIRPALKNISMINHENDYVFIEAGAGASMDALIEFCLDHHIVGLEEFSGIPGTVGGSVFINLHYFEFLLSQFLICAQVIDNKTGSVLTVDVAWFGFGYNQSRLHDDRFYLLSATFALKKADALAVAYARGRRAEIIRHRHKRYPSTGTCGSFFRNFLPAEVTLESAGKKMIYVAYYLDKIGVKGVLRHGKAVVSYQHANMLVNEGGASSSDLILLARTMQERVHDAFGIMPQPECRLVGFAEYPLHK